VLACVGLYGLVTWSVASRTREIGLRMALGRRSGSAVLRMILGQVAVTTAAGLAVGVPATLALTRIVQFAALRHPSARPVQHPGRSHRRDAVALLGRSSPARRGHAHRPRARAPL